MATNPSGLKPPTLECKEKDREILDNNQAKMNYTYLTDVIEPTELAWKNRLMDIANEDKQIKMAEDKK